MHGCTPSVEKHRSSAMKCRTKYEEPSIFQNNELNNVLVIMIPIVLICLLLKANQYYWYHCSHCVENSRNGRNTGSARML